MQQTPRRLWRHQRWGRCCLGHLITNQHRVLAPLLAPRSSPVPPHTSDPNTPQSRPQNPAPQPPTPTLRRGRAPPFPGGSASGAGIGAGTSPRARPRPFRRSCPHARPWPQLCRRDRPRPRLVPWGLLGSPRVSSGPLGAQVPPHPSSEAVTAGTETTGIPLCGLRCSSRKRVIKAWSCECCQSNIWNIGSKAENTYNLREPRALCIC